MQIHVRHDGQGATTGGAAIIIALRRRRMTVAMLVMGRMTGESDIGMARLAMPAYRGAIPMAVLVNDRIGHGSMLVAVMERAKNEADNQERKKAGDEAVPFHDPEKRAQHYPDSA